MNKRCMVYLSFLALIICAKATQTIRPSVGQGPLQSLRLQVLSNTAHLRTLGDDCDGLHWCDSNSVCKDFRCARKGTADDQVAWSPSGLKCDWWHSCKGGLQCVKHRCIRPY